MNINETYKIVSYLVDKYQGTYLSPDDFNMVINMAQRQYLTSLVEDTGRPSNNPRPGNGQMSTSTVGETVGTFMTEATLTIASQLASMPADMYKTTGIRTADNNPVKWVSDEKIASYIKSSIDAPSDTNPIYYIVGGKYKFFPATLTTATLTYIRNPATMRWGNGTTLVYDPSVYNSVSNPNGSTQPEWGDADMNYIIYKAIGIIGINLKDGDLLRAAQMIKQEGQ